MGRSWGQEQRRTEAEDQSLDLAGRIRQKTDQENYRKVKVLVHYLIERQQSRPVIREQYKRRTKKKAMIAWGRSEKDEPTLSGTGSLGDAIEGTYIRFVRTFHRLLKRDAFAAAELVVNPSVPFFHTTCTSAAENEPLAFAAAPAQPKQSGSGGLGWGDHTYRAQGAHPHSPISTTHSCSSIFSSGA